MFLFKVYKVCVFFGSAAVWPSEAHMRAQMIANTFLVIYGREDIRNY